ncbi:hypothetical protein [Schinkia azotoformans]|uniref:hypothetical protein n=1 Tax=Schinkia azotoformans TaxID=1454 RepID=UPI002DB7D5FD|nr:hypothetical protein [Schinkia azotoformans]MEC1742815.1 hypothetical protein [Schinkia azotoformans]MEC1769012.1 hypothetical protein [Schinkia azotoformans]MEC1789597.1 hypothetical protein [Schinkia azotoformans]MED4378421.1 hypothetical protein [Schinkia azotoformans]MED4417435.1 hypothetical protein [Schinkia azotoformans]
MSYKNEEVIDKEIKFSSTDQVIQRLTEKKIYVEKVISRLELMKRLAEYNQKSKLLQLCRGE